MVAGSSEYIFGHQKLLGDSKHSSKILNGTWQEMCVGFAVDALAPAGEIKN